MNIGGYNLNMPNFNMGGMASTLFWGMMIFLIIGVIGYFGYKSFKNKTFYTNKVTLTMFYENGTKKRLTGLKGGKFVNKSGVWDFRIKIPKQFKPKELGYTPSFSKADSDGTLHFITSGDGTIWLQIEEKLAIYGKEQARDENGKLLFGEDRKPLMVDSYKLLLNPVRTDVKIATVNSLKNWAEMVNKQKLTVFGIALGAFLIMVIAHLISLYVQTKVKCGV
jgi:hypothetical protein